MSRDALYRAREAYLELVRELLAESLPEGRDELEYVREQLAELDVSGGRRNG